MIDLHTHILPGLDDGPADVEEALAMCRLAVADGTAAIVASPHMFDGAFNVTRMDILDGVCRLQDVLDAEGIPLRVFPGADVHAVDPFMGTSVLHKAAMSGSADVVNMVLDAGAFLYYQVGWLWVFLFAVVIDPSRDG